MKSTEKVLRVVFAPDWREGVPYQSLLAKALQQHDIEVSFLRGYKRIFPLSRLLSSQSFDLLHVHWPEAYFPRQNDGLDWFRSVRFPFDIAMATRRVALATTAHNLGVHNRSGELFVQLALRALQQRADVIFAHSEVARRKVIETFGVGPGKVKVVPHGDLSITLRSPVPTSEARQRLGLRNTPIALMFGTVEPYKGVEEIISWWKQSKRDAALAIVGRPNTIAYGKSIRALIGNDRSVITRLDWLSDDDLALWLSAANAVIFNYREIFTSGAASLARSYGIPLVLPARLDTVELGEPTPYVLRFSDVKTDFGQKLEVAIRTAPNYAAAAEWRKACSWDYIAATTAAGYRSALGCI